MLHRLKLIVLTGIVLFPSLMMGQAVATERPHLVVGIMIDGLQQRHIDLLWNYLDPNGIRKMIEQGSTLRQMSYQHIANGNASDIASVMTGSTPNFNGIVGNKFFSRAQADIQSIISDENQIGIGTRDKVSAHHLLCTTLLDELMLANLGKSKSYAVAIHPEDALMMGGHSARSVAWIDDAEAKWVTTGYYSEGLSRWADEMNVGGACKNLTSIDWTPLFSINTYLTAPLKEDKKNGFAYDPLSKRSKLSSAILLKNCPAANTMVAELAQKLIVEEQLGQDKYADMLMLQFTVRTPYEKTTALQSAEKEDMYLRLDRDIQNILQKIDAKVGLDKTLFVVFGNQTSDHSPQELGENKVPAGYFNAGRSMALLSTYLMALYGPDKWIEGYYGKNIFLNRKKIEEKKLNLKDMQQTVADFMLEFEGVQSAFTASQLSQSGSNEDLLRLQRSTNKYCRGDVAITMLPGWIEVDEKGYPVGESNAVVPTAPVYFYGWHVPAQKVDKSYNMMDIAPSIARILGIPQPNACTGKVIEEVVR